MYLKWSTRLITSGHAEVTRASTLEYERRNTTKQTKEDLKRLLNRQQKKVFQQMEKSGWRVMFIRNQLLHPMITVLDNVDDRSVVVLEEDGTIKKEHDLRLRLNGNILS